MDVVIFQDSQAVLASVQKEVQRLEMDLDSSNREKVSVLRFLCFKCSSQFCTNHFLSEQSRFFKLTGTLPHVLHILQTNLSTTHFRKLVY